MTSLGISELKWMGLGEFNSEGHNNYYCGQESHRRNVVALTINKRVRNAVLGCNLKNGRVFLIHFQGKPFNITVTQVYAPTTGAKEGEVVQFCEDLQDFPELITRKDVLFIIRDWNAKVGSQEILGITEKFGFGVQNEVGQRLTVLSREHAGYNKHAFPITQEMTLHMDITRWSITKSE